MQPKPPHYRVIAYLAPPDFEAEQAFVRLERQYVARQLERPVGGWTAVARFVDRAPTHKQWLHYDQALQRYEHKLDKLHKEIAAGLTPVKVAVRNLAGHADQFIRVHISIQNGIIHRAKKTPERPKRIDSVKPTNWWALMGAAKFWRSNVRITPHSLRAKFSRLAAGEGAYVVNEPLYIETTKDMALTYEIHSRRLTTAQSGVVD